MLTGATAASGPEAPDRSDGESLDNESKNAQARSKEAGCPARKGPLCRGRCEVAENYVGKVEPFRTATMDRTIALSLPGFEARLVGKYRTRK